MTGNALKNAGFLDGATNYSASGLTLAVDAATRGAPGRIVLVGTATAGGAGTNYTIGNSVGVTVAAGGTFEVFALVGGSNGAVSVEVVIGGVTTQVPLIRAQQATASRGLAETFGLYYLRGVSAGGGSAILNARLISAGAGAVALWIQKPFLDVASPTSPALGFPQVFDPGAHDNADLNRTVWLTAMPRFLASSEIAPVSNLATFATDSQLPINVRTYTGLRHTLRGRMRLTKDQVARLDDFYAARTISPFWFVRPDTNELCFASFLADGQPTPIAHKGAFTMTEVGLLLEGV
jgi:hypothetical protein